MGDGRDDAEQPQEDDGVDGQRQHDADHPGQRPVARLVRQAQQVQHPGRRLGHPAGEPQARQPDRAESHQGEQVLQIVAQHVRLVDVPLPDPLHPDSQLVHGAQACVEEPGQPDEPHHARLVDGAGQLVDQATAERAGERLADGGEQLPLEQGVTGEHQPGDGGDEQEDREEPQEGEVGDPGGHEVALGALVATTGASQVVEPRTAAALGVDGPLRRRRRPHEPRLLRRADGAHRPSLLLPPLPRASAVAASAQLSGVGR